MDEKETYTSYATFTQRLLAHNIDLIPLLILFYLSTLLPLKGYDFIVVPSIYIIYNSLFELSGWKATPGKKYMRLVVTRPKGSKYNTLLIFLRNACKILSLLIFFGGFVMISFNRKKQALHDYIVGTAVLFEQEIA